jgi:hypothetical protein
LNAHGCSHENLHDECVFTYLLLLVHVCVCVSVCLCVCVYVQTQEIYNTLSSYKRVGQVHMRMHSKILVAYVTHESLHIRKTSPRVTCNKIKLCCIHMHTTKVSIPTLPKQTRQMKRSTQRKKEEDLLARQLPVLHSPQGIKTLFVVACCYTCLCNT